MNNVKFQQITPLQNILGLMSGTSLDGVDAVLIETDGQNHIRRLAHHYTPYPEDLQAILRALTQTDFPLNDILRAEGLLSLFYAHCTTQALHHAGQAEIPVHAVGIHGQTIRHLPAEGLTWQLGDPERVAEATHHSTGWHGPLVMNFRKRDMAAGGQGAPLAPLFHEALFKPMGVQAVLNIGGIANITLFHPNGSITATDCGPGMTLLNRLFLEETGNPIDPSGHITASGTADEHRANLLLSHPFFANPLPRTADAPEFHTLYPQLTEGLPLPHAAATLAEATALGVKHSIPAGFSNLLLCGGGSLNQGVKNHLHQQGFTCETSSDHGWPEATIEAAAFAWLTARKLKNLPTTSPSITGASTPTSGGTITYV